MFTSWLDHSRDIWSDIKPTINQHQTSIVMFAGSRSFPLNSYLCTRHTPNMTESEADKIMGLFFSRLAALQIFLATSTVKTNNYVIIPEDFLCDKIYRQILYIFFMFMGF